MTEISTLQPQYVAEVQGLFGPISISERIFQKIWHRGDFRTRDLKTHSGKPFEIISRGRWNKLAGPDFVEAEFLIGGQRVIGDVELHFYADDWFVHAHDKNPNYGRVVLHVLLFPPKKNPPEKNACGNAMETFLLLPHLNIDVEEYASSEAISTIEGRKETESILEVLLEKSFPDRIQLLSTRARERYEQKVRFLKRRLQNSGWEQTLHEIILETLGLHRNRPPMSKLALKFSPSAMLLAGGEALFKTGFDAWNLSGVRPANHPRSRLEQYLNLLEKNPAFSQHLFSTTKALPNFEKINAPTTVKTFRAREKLPLLHKFIANDVFSGTMGGTRFETLMCDAVLPLASAAHGKDLFPLWHYWFIGDAPAKTAKILREANLVSREDPLCNGAFQALLQIALTMK